MTCHLYSSTYHRDRFYCQRLQFLELKIPEDHVQSHGKTGDLNLADLTSNPNTVLPLFQNKLVYLAVVLAFVSGDALRIAPRAVSARLQTSALKAGSWVDNVPGNNINLGHYNPNLTHSNPNHNPELTLTTTLI